MLVPIGQELPGAAIPASAESAAPSSRTEFAVVLSATEHAVYVIGGLDDSGDPVLEVRRFDIRTQTWRRLPLSGPGITKVLAATYRPSDRSLYVIDQGEPGSWGSERRGRLLRVDLGSYVTTVVGDWKRKSNYDRIYLTNAPRRELVLTGSSESKERYRGLRFRYGEASGLEVLGWFQGKGFVAVRPTLNRRGLTLPLKQGADILNVLRPIEDLHGGPSHSFAKCL